MEDYDDILDRYGKMRSTLREMNSALVRYCGPVVEQAAKDLGVWVKGTIVMDMDQMPVLMDHAIHHRFKEGSNIADCYIAEHPARPGSDAETLQAAMGRVFFSMFQVTDVVKDVGVLVTDIFRDRSHLLVDISFSASATKHGVLASRMLPFEGFIMTTGAAQPVDPGVLEWVVENLQREGLTEEDLRALPSKTWAGIETSIVRACLQSGGAQIEYRDVAEGGRPMLSKASERVGRNEPCPCGSGKKYKKCCGP